MVAKLRNTIPKSNIEIDKLSPQKKWRFPNSGSSKYLQTQDTAYLVLDASNSKIPSPQSQQP